MDKQQCDNTTNTHYLPTARPTAVLTTVISIYGVARIFLWRVKIDQIWGIFNTEDLKIQIWRQYNYLNFLPQILMLKTAGLETA